MAYLDTFQVAEMLGLAPADLSEAERQPNAICDESGLLHTAVQAQ